MSKDTFKEQFGDYPVIPEKKALKRVYWVSAWAAFVIGVIVLPGSLFYLLGMMGTPQAAMSGNTPMTSVTVGLMAESQSQAGLHSDAVASFQRYIQLGGDEADLIAQYAYSLNEVGQHEEAKTWAKRAYQTNPKSKAAKLVHDALGK